MSVLWKEDIKTAQEKLNGHMYGKSPPLATKKSNAASTGMSMHDKKV